MLRLSDEIGETLPRNPAALKNAAGERRFPPGGMPRSETYRNRDTSANSVLIDFPKNNAPYVVLPSKPMIHARFIIDA